MNIFRLVFVSFFIFMLCCSNVYSEQLGKISTSGLVFKDYLEIHAFDDPNISGITCYVTAPKRSLHFVDQTDSSISCRKTGKIIGNLVSKSKIFKQKKSWFIKSMFVDRIYDKKRNVLIYISYTKKLSGDNANNSISVVVVNQ